MYLIDKQELFKRLKELPTELGFVNKSAVNEVINSMPNKENRWIPVDEALPDLYTDVLVTYKSKVIIAQLQLSGKRMWKRHRGSIKLLT